MTKYWVVGASWGGVDHQDQRFVKQGMWMLGWEDGKQPQRVAEMQAGDRNAIKRMKGQGQTGIRILHLGIVKESSVRRTRLSAPSIGSATDLDRDISESRSCFKSVHGPFEHDSWIQEVFCL